MNLMLKKIICANERSERGLEEKKLFLHSYGSLESFLSSNDMLK